MIYLITVHETYYPSSGAYDWYGIYRGEHEARAAFKAIPVGYFEGAVLIAIDLEDLTWRELEKK